MNHYQLIIVGAGSAGLPAGMYASRYKISNLVIGADMGGALATSHCVENWPGDLASPGADIMQRFREHALHSGSEIWHDTVASIVEIEPKKFEVTTSSGKSATADFVLLATGNVYRKLKVPGEETLLGSGVSYCATCDGNFFRNKTVAMVGGGDSAFTESLYLAELCEHVHLLVRGEAPKAEPRWVEKVQNQDNITIHYSTEVAEVQGKFAVESLLLKDGSILPVQGIFIAVGSDPNVQLIEAFGLEKDGEGCIIVDTRQATSYPHIYAAGDVTTNSNKFKQTIMSAAEGCLSANSIHEDILNQ